MKIIWAPWRMRFILDSKKEQSGCILCNLIEKKDGIENLVLSRSAESYIVINKYPYNTGHLMVVPNEHESDFTKLSIATMASIGAQSQKAVSVLNQAYKPAGFNIGVNLGEAAGAGIPKHVHYHIVPRWVGDANFMPIIGQTKVLPETVDDTYRKLKPYF